MHVHLDPAGPKQHEDQSTSDKDTSGRDGADSEGDPGITVFSSQNAEANDECSEAEKYHCDPQDPLDDRVVAIGIWREVELWTSIEPERSLLLDRHTAVRIHVSDGHLDQVVVVEVVVGEERKCHHHHPEKSAELRS